jgi:hypothetical protein
VAVGWRGGGQAFREDDRLGGAGRRCHNSGEDAAGAQGRGEGLGQRWFRLTDFDTAKINLSGPGGQGDRRAEADGTNIAAIGSDYLVRGRGTVS